MKKALQYDSAFVTANTELEHHLTGANRGVLFLTRNNKDVVGNFQYATGKGKLKYQHFCLHPGVIFVMKHVHNPHEGKGGGGEYKQFSR